MNLREAAQRALEALENDPVLENANNNATAWLRAALAEDAMQRLTNEQQEIKNGENTVQPTDSIYSRVSDSGDRNVEAVTDCRDKVGDKLSQPLDRSADTGKTSDHIADAGKMVEPVAFFYKNFTRRIRGVLTQEDFIGDKSAFLKYCMADKNLLPLYPAPPKREPLTSAEIQECVAEVDDARLAGPITALIRAVERKLGIGGEE